MAAHETQSTPRTPAGGPPPRSTEIAALFDRAIVIDTLGSERWDDAGFAARKQSGDTAIQTTLDANTKARGRFEGEFWSEGTFEPVRVAQNNRSAEGRKRCRVCGSAFVLCRLAPSLFSVFLVFGSIDFVLAGQRVDTASIQGKVTDNTAGALPGVTVTVSSPSLQVREIAAVTSADGTYRLVNLPPAVYRISYELSGFQTVVREGVRVSAGFAARIDTVMEIGALKETVTVSAASPVVDVSATTGTTTLTKEMLETMPNSRTLWQALAMTPGIRMTGAPDVGGNLLKDDLGYSNYGTRGQNTPEVEGIQTREADSGTGMYNDYSAIEELVVRAAGSGPETGTPGVNFIVVVKSGGNDFHGAYGAFGQTAGMQSENLSEALRAQGIGRGNPQKYYWDFNGDLGGRIIRDKLWFYGALRDSRSVSEVIGYSRTPGPDGVYGTNDDERGEGLASIAIGNAKLSYQMTRKYQLVGFFVKSLKREPERSGSRFIPAESTVNQRSSQVALKGEFQGVPNDKILFNVAMGWHRQIARFKYFEDIPGKPTRYDLETGRYTGAHNPSGTFSGGIARGDSDVVRLRPQSHGSVSFFPGRLFGGEHSFKLGYGMILAKYGQPQRNKRSGNYMLIYDRVQGVPHQPVELVTWNFPISGPGNRHNEFFAYVKDDWRAGARVSGHVGLRFERYHNFVVEQTKEQGPFGGSGSFPGVEVVTWKAVAPRIGVAFDVTGDARTVLKGTYGWYNLTAGDYFADNFNVNSVLSTSYRWRDLDGNNDYTPGEVDLNPNGRDFLTVSGATNNIVNPDLRQPAIQEVTTALERELMANFGAKLYYVYRREMRLYEPVNVLRPYSAYNIPLVRRDPGPDGVLNTSDDGTPVTLYDHDPAFRGAAFVGRKWLNREGKDNSYHTIEATLSKRTSQNWNMLASFSATKNHLWLDGIPESPNDEFFPLNSTWNWQFKAVGGYHLPYDLRLSAFFQHLSGAPQQRTYIFRRVDPDGGPPLRELSTVTLRLEPIGARRQANLNVLHLRGAKTFSLGGTRRLEIDLDLFNALNANAATQVDSRSGSTFGLISQILPPRVARLGAMFRF